MIGIAISGTRDNGMDFCAAETGTLNNWTRIQNITKEIWKVFPGRTIDFPDDMTQMFLERVERHQAHLPDKPVALVGDMPEVDIPLSETAHEFGGFTLTYKHKHMIIFRYNTKLNTVQEMINELKRIYLIEFLVRSKMGDPESKLVPDAAFETNQASFMTRLPNGGLFINFWNHTMEDGLRERFIAAHQQQRA